MFSTMLSTPGQCPPSGDLRRMLGKVERIFSQMSSIQNPGCLGSIGDYTTQLYRDYNKPL